MRLLTICAGVSQVCKVYGGGGHIRAAGCSLRATAFDVINSLTFHIEKRLEFGKEAGRMNGIMNVKKEKGFTSHDVVAKLRGILHFKK